MSSAILYVAIVVIWAAVLIPRWLRRDPVVPVSAGEAEIAFGVETRQVLRGYDRVQGQAGG